MPGLTSASASAGTPWPTGHRSATHRHAPFTITRANRARHRPVRRRRCEGTQPHYDGQALGEARMVQCPSFRQPPNLNMCVQAPTVSVCVETAHICKFGSTLQRVFPDIGDLSNSYCINPYLKPPLASMPSSVFVWLNTFMLVSSSLGPLRIRHVIAWRCVSSRMFWRFAGMSPSVVDFLNAVRPQCSARSRRQSGRYRHLAMVFAYSTPAMADNRCSS